MVFRRVTKGFPQVAASYHNYVCKCHSYNYRHRQGELCTDIHRINIFHEPLVSILPTRKEINASHAVMQRLPHYRTRTSSWEATLSPGHSGRCERLTTSPAVFTDPFVNCRAPRREDILPKRRDRRRENQYSGGEQTLSDRSQ